MAVLLAGTLLAGCTSAPQVPSDPCESVPCSEEVEPSVAPPPPRGTNLSVPEAKYPVFQAADCEGFYFVMLVPIDEVRDLVPAAFIPSRALGDDMGGILFLIHHCARSLDADTVFGPITIQTALALVTPVNETWGETGHQSVFVIEEATNSPAWNDEMALIGRSAVTADMTQERHDLPDGSFLARWTTSTDSWETTLEFPLVSGGGEGQSVGYDRHYWYGDGPYHRMTVAKQGDLIGLPVPSAMRVAGDSKLAGMTMGPVHPGDYFVGDDLLLQYDGAWTKT